MFCAWYIIEHHIIFREILYFIVVINDSFFTISWASIPTSVRTLRWVENFHKQIAVAKAILPGTFMKLIKCFTKHTWPWIKCRSC